MAKPTYTSAQWQRGMRSLLVVSIVNSLIVSLLVGWFIGRVELLPALIGILAFCVAAVPPSLWLLRKHLDTGTERHAGSLGRRRHR